MYAGVANKARRVAGAYVGVGGVARKVRGIYSGDEAGIARVVWGKGFAPGVITPSNMTSDSAPTPFAAKAKNVWGGSYLAYLSFNSNNGAGTEGCFSVQMSFGEGGIVTSDGEWWVEIDLGSAKFADEGRLRIPAVADGRAVPKDFKILGTNDSTAWDDNISSDKWIEVGSVVDYSSVKTQYEWLPSFILDNPGYYRYYRIKVTKVYPLVTTYYCIGIGQIELRAA